MPSTNEAFARVKIDSVLAAQGGNTRDTSVISFEIFMLEGKCVEHVQPIQITFTGVSIAKSI